VKKRLLTFSTFCLLTLVASVGVTQEENNDREPATATAKAADPKLEDLAKTPPTTTEAGLPTASGNPPCDVCGLQTSDVGIWDPTNPSMVGYKESTDSSKGTH
jgi:hypothetical protein